MVEVIFHAVPTEAVLARGRVRRYRPHTGDQIGQETVGVMVSKIGSAVPTGAGFKFRGSRPSVQGSVWLQADDDGICPAVFSAIGTSQGTELWSPGKEDQAGLAPLLNREA